MEQPKTYLCPGTVNNWRADKPITPKVLWEACREAAQAAGITKTFAPIYYAIVWQGLVRRLAGFDAVRRAGSSPGHEALAPVHEEYEFPLRRSLTRSEKWMLSPIAL